MAAAKHRSLKRGSECVNFDFRIFQISPDTMWRITIVNGLFTTFYLLHMSYLLRSSHKGGNPCARTSCRNPRKTCPPPWRRPKRRDWWRSTRYWIPKTSLHPPPSAASWVSWWQTRRNLAVVLKRSIRKNTGEVRSTSNWCVAFK